ASPAPPGCSATRFRPCRASALAPDRPVPDSPPPPSRRNRPHAAPATPHPRRGQPTAPPRTRESSPSSRIAAAPRPRRPCATDYDRQAPRSRQERRGTVGQGGRTKHLRPPAPPSPCPPVPLQPRPPPPPA